MDAVSEVKARLNIEDVISEYVQLKRAGKNYKGLSPFTNEKTPSFVVSPDKQIWHDFSSGNGGDMFTFVQTVEGLDFKQALELLARKAGVDLEQYRSPGGGRSGPDKERLHAVLEAAAEFYYAQLKSHKQAYQYLTEKRQFNQRTIDTFRLGVSPDRSRALTDHLKLNGFTNDELKAAGVSVERRNGLSDMFRGRIMIPLCDPFGRVVGFTARLLVDAPSAPKYINTPATVLYDKSRHIYGLHLAKKAIQKEKVAVIVEGNLDVIASHQAGISYVVATAGTALTEMQLKHLGRLTPDVRLAFDQDRAGLAAAERAIPLAGKTGVNLSIITIPSGKDPDELIKHDPQLWVAAIGNNQPALDWLLGQYEQRLDLTSAAGKREFSDVAVAIIRLLPDAVERDHYIQIVANTTQVHSDSLRAKLEQVSSTSGPKKMTVDRNLTKTQPIRLQAEDTRAQQHFLAITLMSPKARQYLELTTEHMFRDDAAKLLLLYLQTHPDFDGNLVSATELQPIADYVKILSLQFEELYGEIEMTELQYEAARLRAKIIDQFVKKQNKIIQQKLATAEQAEATDLLARVNKLNNLLKRTRVS